MKPLDKNNEVVKEVIKQAAYILHNKKEGNAKYKAGLLDGIILAIATMLDVWPYTAEYLIIEEHNKIYGTEE